MGRQFAYIGSDMSLLELALERCGESLVVDDGQPFNGWGLGYYADDRALLRKRPVLLQGRLDLRALVADVHSSSVLCHVRRATRAPARPSNTQPFRFRSWLFSHVGRAADSEAVEKALTERLPDFLLRNVRGETDSEAALHLYFDHLRATSARIDHPVAAPAALIDAMRLTLAEIDRINRDNGAEQPPTLDMLYTSGRMIVATNRSSSRLAWMRIEGLEQVEPPLFAGHHPKTTEYPQYRGVFVTYDPHGTDGDWQLVEPEHVLVVDERFEVHTAPIAAP